MSTATETRDLLGEAEEVLVEMLQSPDWEARAREHPELPRRMRALLGAVRNLKAFGLNSSDAGQVLLAQGLRGTALDFRRATRSLLESVRL